MLNLDNQARSKSSMRGQQELRSPKHSVTVAPTKRGFLRSTPLLLLCTKNQHLTRQTGLRFLNVQVLRCFGLYLSGDDMQCNNVTSTEVNQPRSSGTTVSFMGVLFSPQRVGKRPITPRLVQDNEYTSRQVCHTSPTAFVTSSQCSYLFPEPQPPLGSTTPAR